MSGSAAAIASVPARVPRDAPAQQGFSRLAWGALAYTVFVILLGAVVRITGSGAGCGQHWPTCQGEVAHLPKSAETAIELSHRLTSGLSFVFVIVLAVLAFRRFPRGHAVRKGAGLSILFMVTESLVGAALVLLALVGKNDSATRAWVMAAHLINTSLLLGAMTVTAWASTHRTPESWRPRGVALAMVVGLLGVLLVSTTGAVTALGDTLYPVQASAGLDARLGGAHFLERVRLVHPIVAVLVSAFLLVVVRMAADARPASDVLRWSGFSFTLVLAQLAAGLINVLLSAPAWMQVLHLLIATLVWIALVLLETSLLAAEPAT